MPNTIPGDPMKSLAQIGIWSEKRKHNKLKKKKMISEQKATISQKKEIKFKRTGMISIANRITCRI